MFNLEGINNVEIDENNLEKEAVKVNEFFDTYEDCVKTEEDFKSEKKDTYEDCVKTEEDFKSEKEDTYEDCIKTVFDIEEEKRKLEQLRTMFEDCGLIDSNNSEKIR